MDKLHFPARNEFDQTLRQRVDAYIKSNNLKQTGTRLLHMKAIASYLFVFACYIGLVFFCHNIWLAFALTFLLVQGQIIIAFNVMHDGGHGSFSSKKWLNNLAAHSMDFLGSSSMLWKQKHNNLHHTYTNVAGKDDDLDVGGMIRLSPEQERKSWHRFQHLYAPVLYGFLSLYLLFYSDFQKIITRKIGDAPLQGCGKKEVLFFVLTKSLYFTVMLIIPSFFHSFWAIAGLFLLGHLIFGATLSIVFQLAHTVVEAEFPAPAENGHMPYTWVEHQIKTTANFAPNNAFVTFYCGGLNYQVEHHLFHRISHVHYPKLSHIVKSTCEEFGHPYHVSPSFWHALKSHFTFLKRLGTT